MSAAGMALNPPTGPRLTATAPRYPTEAAPELCLYRQRTVQLLRRYLRYSIETGRLPSLMGTEFFRSRVTSYAMTTFEDRVIFVHDVEVCLRRLDEFSQQIITRIVLQEFTHAQTARLLHCTRMTVHRQLLETLDRLSQILLELGLLQALPGHGAIACQEGVRANFSATHWEDGE